MNKLTTSSTSQLEEFINYMEYANRISYQTDGETVLLIFYDEDSNDTIGVIQIDEDGVIVEYL